MVGDLHIRIAKLAFYAKESPIQTRAEVLSLVSSRFNSPDDVYSPAVPDTPLSRTPSIAPELGFNDDESGSQHCLPHCKAGSSSEYSKVIIERFDRVRICKIIFICHRRENDISQMQSADNFLDNAMCHFGRVIIRTVFLQPATAHIARRFP